MATTLFLVRHAVHTLVDRVLVGRMSNVRLEEPGRRQAELLAGRLAETGLTAIQSSPRERARETAAPIARRAGLRVEIAPDIDEIDVGEWTGQRFDALAADPRWYTWNTSRGTARPPGGESMGELQARVLGHLETLRTSHPHARIALVTHAEVIRAALLHYLALPLDDFLSVEVRPASVSTVRLDMGGAKIIALNEVVSA